MKLSLKFFCVAYMVVLLSTGLGGAYIILHINHTLWNTRVERVNAAVNYATDSFMAFADISYTEMSASLKNDAVRQIQNTCDSVVTDIEIHTDKTAKPHYTQLADNTCAVTFLEKDEGLVMESACKLTVGPTAYYLVVYADFTDIRQQCEMFWNRYGLVVLSISAVSGLVLFALARKITRPLGQLTQVADEIAQGNYGKKADIRTADQEIHALSDSVNAMSFAIEQRITEIRQSLENRDMFVADFTHEMKTPMTAIIGYAQMLRSYTLTETEREQAAGAIYSEAKRLEKLSLQLLDLYVYQNENVEMTAIDLCAIEAQLNTTLKYLCEKYDVACRVDLGTETVVGNSVLLLSLLYNLADNALKASAPRTTVTICAVPAADTVHITVADTGRGIAKENIPLLTEPFYREDKSRSRKLGGAGLGLSLCKEIAKLHGTQLQFESEKGKGTRVSFSLMKGGV